LIGANEARMLIHDRVVVSTTRISDSPSTPTLYWMPKTGIQSWLSMSWKARPDVGSNPISRRSEIAHARRLAASPSRRA